MNKSCPTCKQVIPSKVNVRMCYNCNYPIELHDKYRYVNRFGITTLEHRHCDNKQSYLPAKVSYYGNMPSYLEQPDGTYIDTKGIDPRVYKNREEIPHP